MTWVLEGSPIAVGTVTVLLTIGFALLGLFLFRRVVPQSRLAESGSVTGSAFTLVGILYPLVAAFALSTVWDGHQAAQSATENEAAAVADLLYSSEALPPATRSSVSQETLAYAQDVMTDEFPRMRLGLPIESRSEQLRKIRRTLSSAEPRTRQEIQAYDECVTAMERLNSSRSERTGESSSGSKSQLEPEIWVLLIGGAIISVAFTYMVATEDVAIHATCVALTAALLGFVLYLILTLDRPFVGSLAVSTDSYQQVVDDWLARPPLR